MMRLRGLILLQLCLAALASGLEVSAEAWDALVPGAAPVALARGRGARAPAPKREQTPEGPLDGPDLAKLGGLWNGVTEFMLDVPILDGAGAATESLVVLVPSSEAPPSMGRAAMPAALCQHTVFALTAFDPPGVSRTLSENTEANGLLWQRLAGVSPRPQFVWRAFGVHVAEGWREDGFCVAYDAVSDGAVQRVAAAREVIVGIARQFGQGAIFEYEPSCGNEIIRLTVPAAGGDVVKGREVLVRTSVGPRLSGVLDRPWAGPVSIGINHGEG